jgi:hypothetical protein
MKKFFLSLTIFTITICHFSIAQSVTLTAVYDTYNSAVKLNWNMVKSNSRTSYILLKSTNGIEWTEAVKDRIQRYYDNDDLYFFNDRNYTQGRNYYRLRIADGSNKTVALSTVVLVNVGRGTSSQTQTPSVQRPVNTTPKTIVPQNNSSNNSSSNSWVIYPNPATDLLTLSYNGRDNLKGVVNVQIIDASGKTVIKFRSGSMYKKIEIPISGLQRGAYFIRVTVVNELMMNQRFIKQ